MPTILAPVLKQRFFDVNGAPLSGGLLYSYIAGTTTPLVTYSNKAATAANTNPIILDSAGECDLWMLPGSYKFILSNSADVAQWTRDGVEIVDPENADDSFTDISYITDADSPVTVSTGASGTMYSVNASAGNVIINLPSIAALSLTNGYSVGVKKTDSSTNTVTINPDGTDTIQGVSIFPISLI